MDKKPQDQHEYEYDEVDTSTVFGGGETVASIWQRLLQRKGVLALGVILAVLLLYKLSGILFSSRTQAPKPAAPVATAVPSRPVAPPTPVDLDAKLTLLQRQEMEKQVAATQAVERMETNITALQQQINAINGTLQDITAQLQRLQKPIAPTVKKPKPQAKKTVVRPRYYLQALIPERAWLKDAKGDTLTVSRGDQLPGYGIITTIDVAQGMVETSSGEPIHYRSNDR